MRKSHDIEAAKFTKFGTLKKIICSEEQQQEYLFINRDRTQFTTTQKITSNKLEELDEVTEDDALLNHE